MHQRAAEADFLLHAARELAAWPISERVESRGFQQVVDARATLAAPWPNRRPKKSMLSNTLSVG